MKQNTPEYRAWKKNQDEKKLRKRTKRKRRGMEQRTRQRAARMDFERSLKESPDYDPNTRWISFGAPAVFSIVENPSETIHFLIRFFAFLTFAPLLSEIFSLTLKM